jgi:hypothetical protein
MEKAPMTIEAWSIYVYDSDPRREGRRFDVNIGTTLEIVYARLLSLMH